MAGEMTSHAQLHSTIHIHNSDYSLAWQRGMTLFEMAKQVRETFILYII